MRKIRSIFTWTWREGQEKRIPNSLEKTLGMMILACSLIDYDDGFIGMCLLLLLLLSLQSCPTLCDPTDSSPPSSAVPGILQARVSQWVAISFSKVYYSQLMNEDPRNILFLMKETSYKTGTCERLNRVEVNSQKGKENRYRVGRYRDMKNYNNASELGCFRMQSAFPLLSHFVLVATSSEKAMAPYSSTLAWRIPGTAEPGRLPSMGSHRVGHDWSDLAAAAGYMVGPCWFSILNIVVCTCQSQTPKHNIL